MTARSDGKTAVFTTLFEVQHEETLKLQEKNFKSQKVRIRVQSQLLDKLVTLDKILLKAKGRAYDARMVWRTQVDIKTAEYELARARNEQITQFRALSTEDQKKMAGLVGLEHLVRAQSSADERVPAVNAPAISDKSPAMPGNIRSEDTNKQVRMSGSAVPFQPSYIQENLSFNQNNISRMYGGEQPHRQWQGGGIGQVPHKRVEALGGLSIPQPHPHSSVLPPQQALWTIDEDPSQIGSQAQPNPWLGAVDVDELLTQNRERQQLLIAELRMSKNDILQMQEDMRRAEEVEGRPQPRVDVDLEAFLAARDVGWADGEDKDVKS